MSDQFDSPGSTTGIKWADHENRLLLIKPLEKDIQMKTSYGDAAAVRADVYVLDGPNSGEAFIDTLIFPKVLGSQVSGNAGTGRYNLGRLGKGVAKAGQSAPWTLADPTSQDADVARAFLAQQATDAPPPF